MKKIGFISKNKLLAQSLASFIRGNTNIQIEPYLLLNFRQAVLDAEVLKIDVAVIEMIAGIPEEADRIMSLCRDLRKSTAGCQILLLVPQDSREVCDMAVKAVNTKAADDYVFVDTSLDYLLAKLLTI